MEEVYIDSLSELAYLLSRDCPDHRFALCFGAGVLVFLISNFLGDICFDLCREILRYFKNRREDKS